MNQTTSHPLGGFLNNNKYSKTSKLPVTHTRIGYGNEIYGGSYSIQGKDLNDLYSLVSEYVVLKNMDEYLTEVQQENGPIAIDLDFRYDLKINKRQHDKDDMISILCLFSEILLKIYKFNENDKFNIFAFEKPNINKCENEVKDGIHILIGIHSPANVQKYLRSEALKMFEDKAVCPLEIPITNTWDKVYDEGIANRTTFWQLFGCKKPNNEAYKLTYQFELVYEDGTFSFNEKDCSKFDYANNYKLLSVQYQNNPSFDIIPELFEHINGLTSKKKRSMKPRKLKLINSNIDLNNIKSPDELDGALQEIFEDLKPCEYIVKEAYEYTMVLPKEYYCDYNKWFNVGCALKNTDPRLFLAWMLFSCQWEDFDFTTDISKNFELWKKMNTGDGCLTNRSIIYWAKNFGNNTEYKKVYEQTIDYHVEQTFPKQTDFDLAMVLYQMYKDKYVCTCTKSTGSWMKFEKHKWVQTDATDLHLLISKEMSVIYTEKIKKNIEEMGNLNETEDTTKWNYLRSRSATFSNIGINLRNNSNKNSIMSEAKALFKDDKFLEKLDANPLLLCFDNGVYDFNEGCFRPGRPEDYISLTTKINYYPLLDNNKKTILKPPCFEDGVIAKEITMDIALKQVEAFMDQLFPNPSLKEYMYEHLASTLLGKTKDQTFNIYTGAGSNGKSKLVDLMTKCLGDLKGTVPITLVTQKRTGLGSATPELSKLKGKRLAVMQEPQKKEKINEGILKELTGGDIIQGRALYQDSVEFLPQFKLVVCTNSLFDITATDNGTWRRIRVCGFESVFTENPVDDDPDQPHQYKVDKELDNNFDVWKYALMAKLVAIAQKTKGTVKDCDVVMASSNKYREGQDYFLAFGKEKIEKCDESERAKIKKGEVLEVFKQWYAENYGGKPPQGKDLFEYMDKKYGKAPKSKGWSNVRIIYDNDDETELNI